MGNKCTNKCTYCKNEKETDLSNNIINEIYKGSQYDMNTISDRKENKQISDLSTRFLKYEPKLQPSLTPEQTTQLNKYIRGYLFRKNYNNILKNKLIENSNEIYSEFMKKYAQNSKVNEILYSNNSKITSILTINWDEYYSEDPIEEKKEEISKIKKYKKGLIIKYHDNNLNLSNINEIIKQCDSLYKGEVDIITNKRCGIGELIYKSGSQKYGTWYNNEFIGWNRLIDSNGVLFIGLFLKNELNGKGIRYIKEKNLLYNGDFVNGLRDGNGIEESDSAKYEGQFYKDKKCGKGKIVFNSGDTYEGGFENNKFNGEGHYIWKKNGHEYIGEYLNGQFNGKGIYKWNENEYYRGDYKMGVKEGNGEVKYANGKKYSCPFVNGKPNGIGIYEDGKGNKSEIEFVDGKINRNFKPRK